MTRILSPRSARWTAAAAAATTLAWLVAAAPGAPAATTPHGRGPAAARTAAARTAAAHAAVHTVAASTPAGTGASDITNLGSGGWEVQSSAVATQTGAQISTPGFNTSTWLPVTNDDAGAPWNVPKIDILA
jgi:exo-1,4-beta-D-glucosaminidase